MERAAMPDRPPSSPSADPRLPIAITRLAGPPPAGWAVIVEGEAPSPVPPLARLPRAERRRHPVGVACFCCAPRSAAALALAALLRELASGRQGSPRGLVLVPETQGSGQALSEMLRSDPLLSARLQEVPPPVIEGKGRGEGD
jgi:hypothetical protein